jgi:chromosome segregation ATPase
MRDIVAATTEVSQLRDNLTTLTAEPDRLSCSIEQNDKLLSDLLETTSTGQNQVIQAKQDIMRLKGDVEVGARQNGEHSRKRHSLKHTQYDLMVLLGSSATSNGRRVSG